MIHLENQFWNEPVSIQLAKQIERNRDKTTAFFTRLVGDSNGQVIAVGSVWQPLGCPRDHIFQRIMVDTLCRKRGFGREMETVLSNTIEQCRPSIIKTSVRDDDFDSLNWAKRRGFIEDGRSSQSLLRLSTYDSGQFLELVEKLQFSGVKFVSLNNVGVSTSNWSKVFELVSTMNSKHFEEEFKASVVTSPSVSTDGILLAIHDNKWVGVAILERWEDNKYYNRFTGVHPDYRRRGIGTALKHLAVVHAKRMGAESMMTDNNSANADILNINRRMGYRQLVGQIALKREIDWN